MTPLPVAPVADETYVWLAIAALTVCTILTRAGYLWLGDRMPLPDGVKRALRYAPAAALVAIIVPDVLPLQANGVPAFDFKLLAAAVAAATMWYTRSAVAMIAAGMCALWLLRWVAA